MRYNRDLLTALLMGFVSGYTTGNTKVRFNTFGGMMTGNTVKLGITMAQGDWPWTGVFAASISMFFIGTIFALYMIQKIGELRFQHLFLLIFMACFILTDGLALAVDTTPESYNIYASLVSSLAAFALGAQNLLSQKSGVIKANTTFMTGNIQKMAEAVWNAWQKRNKGGLSAADKRAAAVLFCTWISYIGGGVCGAATAAVKTFHWSLTPVSVLYAIGMASMQIEPPKEKPKDKPKPAAAGAAVEQVMTTPNAMVVEVTPGAQAQQASAA